MSLHLNENFIGFRVGQLTVLKFIEKTWYGKGKRYDYFYECQCSCGNKQTFVKRVLISSFTKKSNTICCKNCQKLKLKNNRVAIKYDNDVDRNIGIVYSNYKSRAKLKNIKFDLSFYDFKNFCLNECYYCGLPPNNCRKSELQRRGISNLNLSGIDRIDSFSGYTKENSRSCCEDCNKAKNNLTESQFLELIKRIYEKHLTTEI